MSWSTPKTWVVGETLTASDMNTYVSDNLNALKDPPSDTYEANEASDYTTSSTSFVDVDAVNLALTITTYGGDVMVGFTGMMNSNNTSANHLNIDVDGTPVAGDDGICGYGGGTTKYPISFVHLITGLSAASHTFKLQWKVVAGATATLYAGAGTAGFDIHPQLWVREVS